MASYTPNLNLYKPDSTDDFGDFRTEFNNNMDILDQGGGGSGDVVDVEVNGISVVDAGTKIAEITSYEEVTIAEYESIPVADRESNGIAYFIKDLNNSDVQGYPPLIYSTDEREIGVWANGKPLYQITFDYTASPITINTSWTKINSIDDIIPINGFAVKQDSNQAQFLIDIDVDSGDGTYVRAIKEQAVAKYITIQYTKESDTAGSGIWNGQGGYAHHYSTSETVVGTWIDGKPLYEKTISYTASTSVGVHDIETLSSETNVVKIEGIGIYQNQKIPIPYYGGNNDYYLLWTDGTKLQEYRGSANGFSGTQMYVTIQYTKTTD